MNRLSRVYLARHGQVLGHENMSVYGHTDVDLTEVGLAQSSHLADRLRLAEIRAIYSSDLKRSVTGARIIARHHNVPLRAVAELKELHFGAWEGLSMSEIRRRFPEELDRRKADILNYRISRDGETIAELSDRIIPCFRRILEEQVGSDFVVVGHGAVNRVILCHALGLELSRLFSIQQDYGCLNVIDYFPDSTLVRLMNG
jgi:alpha-ribazole phosphatase/probable phosphoglycerate mutase